MNRGRIKFLLLGAVFVAPVLLSYGTYFFWKPTKIGSHGELLIPPRVVADFIVRDSDGKSFPFKNLGGKWIILLSDSSICEAACQKKLQTARQAHAALGKNKGRVRRVVLIDDGKPNDATNPIREEDLVWLDATDSEFHRKLPIAVTSRDYIYLVDPLGNLFMRYHKDVDIRGVIKDLERALKASQIG